MKFLVRATKRLPVKMSSLQNSVCQKVRKLILHQIKQLHEGLKTFNAIEACKHFNNQNRNLSKYGKFTGVSINILLIHKRNN